MDILDLRTLAEEWQDLVDELDDEDLNAEERADIIEQCEKYESLAQEISGDSTPADLDRWANDYDCTLIPERDFKEYAQELAEEIGAIPDDVSWPMTCIDWERAARELLMDYTSVTYDGTDYYIRSC